MNYRNDSRGRQLSPPFEFFPTQQASCSPAMRSNGNAMVSSLQNLQQFFSTNPKQFQSVKQQIQSGQKCYSHSPNQNNSSQNFYKPSDKENLSNRELCESIVKQYVATDSKASVYKSTAPAQSTQSSTQKLPLSKQSSNVQNYYSQDSQWKIRSQQLECRLNELEQQQHSRQNLLHQENLQLANDKQQLLVKVKEKEKQLEVYKETMKKLDVQLAQFQQTLVCCRRDNDELHNIIKQKDLAIKSLSLQLQSALLAHGQTPERILKDELPLLMGAREQIDKVITILQNKQNGIVSKDRKIQPKKQKSSLQQQQNLTISSVNQMNQFNYQIGGEQTLDYANGIELSCQEHVPESNIEKCQGIKAQLQPPQQELGSINNNESMNMSEIITKTLNKRGKKN